MFLIVLLFEVHSIFYLAVTDFLIVASPQCVQGFLNEEAVSTAAEVYATDETYNVRTHQRQQRIIPGIKFTCTGTLTKWIIGAQRRQATNPQHLQLQIWRQRQGSDNKYNRKRFSDITALNITDDLNVYEYIPNPPLEFQANDILGLHHPQISDTQVVVYYQMGDGPQNFRRLNQNSPLTSISASRGNTGNKDLPLVAVEVNGKMNFYCLIQKNYDCCFCYVVFSGGNAESCTEGFITREQLADEALLIEDFADPNQDNQQLIIPNMTFTTSGSVVRWTFAARYNASATQYPELQVWRENTTGTYVKVGSTGNMEPAQTAYLNVYEYVLDSPLQVLAGDVLGIYQPSSSNSRVHLLLLSDSNHVNWYTEVSRPQDTFMVAGSEENNALPLVAVSFEPEGELYLYTVNLYTVGISSSLPSSALVSTALVGSSTGLPTSTPLPHPGTLHLYYTPLLAPSPSFRNHSFIYYNYLFLPQYQLEAAPDSLHLPHFPTQVHYNYYT